MPKKDPKTRPVYNALVKLSTLGSVILGLALLGLWLDQKFHTVPVYTIIGIFLGVLCSFYEAWRIHQ